MTFGQIIYNLQNIHSGGIQSDDNNLSDRQVGFIVNMRRAQMAKEAGNNVPSDMLQTLSCLPMKCVDQSECCEIQTGCCIMRTVDPLPEIITSISVSTVDNFMPIAEIEFAQTFWDKYSKFTKKFLKFYRKNGYLYLFSNDIIEYIKVTAVFSEPEKVYELDCKIKECEKYNWLDMEYPFPAEWHHTLFNKISREEYFMLKRSFNDITNNAKDETVNNDK